MREAENEAAKGRRVLVVEDEFLIAEELRESLEELGVEVVGPVSTVSAAVELIRSGAPLDGATLDVTLGREKSMPVAEALRLRGVPFVFLTGYATSTLPEALRETPTCQKPATARELLARLFA